MESPTVIAVATAIIVVGQVVQSYLNWKTGQRAQADAKVARGAAEDAADQASAGRLEGRAARGHLSEKLDGIAKVADATYTLGNHRLSLALKEKVEDKKRIYELTTGAEEKAAALRAWELAAQASAEHEAKQVRVDERAAVDTRGGPLPGSR